MEGVHVSRANVLGEADQIARLTKTRPGSDKGEEFPCQP